MADPALLQALDYILNQSDAATIEVLSEALIKRRRNLSFFHAVGEIPDPEKAAKEVSAALSGSTDKIIEGMRSSIHEMIVRLISEHAPELNADQINELCRAWMPSTYKTKEKSAKEGDLPPEALLSMIDQFISFSNGTMSSSVDTGLRNEVGAWPERYWNAFPPVVRQIITDYLKNKIGDKDFKSKIVLALGL